MVAEHPLLVLLGPTASGKTALSVELASRFAGEIVSCDSVAIYRGLEIGAAKPGRDERARIPHHLLDIRSPEEPFTAGDYSRLARAAIADITSRDRLPLVTGGSGLYLRALLEGLFPGPRRSDNLRRRLRAAASRRGSSYVHRIHPNDLPKSIRAIEVSLAARQPMSRAWDRGRDPLVGYRILRLGLDPDRADLYARINARARRMFDRGLIEETAALLAQHGEPRADGPLPDPLRSLGYREAAAVLDGTIELEAAVVAVSQGHRNYAKRQMTWFRREPEVHWLRGFGDASGIQAEAAGLIEKFLRG